MNDTDKRYSAGGCDGRAKAHGREEPPHVRGQGHKLGGPHARRVTAKRSYPASEVRGSGRQYQTAMVQERPRGATPRPRSGGAAERRYPASEVRGCDERSYPTSEVRGSGPECQTPTAQERPRAATPCPRPGAAGGRSNATPEARGCGREEIPRVQGKGRRREELPHV